MVRLSSWLLAVVCVVGAGCGLISSDVDDFRLGFPEKDFTVDTADWGLQGSGTVPQVDCGVGCGSLQSSFCPTSVSCTTDCETSTNFCQAHVTVGIWQNFNLAVERPEYQQIEDQARVRVDTVDFRIDENTLTIATPVLTVYMGPVTATSPSDQGVVLIGTIAPVAAMATGTGTLAMTDVGRMNMEEFVTNFRTPFNVIVTGTVDIQAGDPIPSGRLVGVITATVFADAI